jgi:membrane dipeptidase
VKLDYIDHRNDKAAWARELGVSTEAIDLYLASDVVDLHIETFNVMRLFGYDLTKKHGHGPFDARLFGQVDLPRVREAGVTGGMWSISTNPLRPSRNRASTFAKNLARYKRVLSSCTDDVALCKNLADYRSARAQGKHGAFLAIQGGNALDNDLSALDLCGDDIVRITLVHLSTSKLGVTSAPGWGKRTPGLTDLGKRYVERMNEKRIFVDLAHIDRKGFFDAVDVHDQSQPLIVTHTGVNGVLPHWRNIDDEQIKAIAKTGGTIGIIYQMAFLGGDQLAPRIVDHMQHIVDVAGEDFVSLGSDWDGMILPPRDMPTCLELPKLAQIMLNRGWKPERVQKVLGGNFLRALGLLRGDARTSTTTKRPNGMNGASGAHA